MTDWIRTPGINPDNIPGGPEEAGAGIAVGRLTEEQQKLADSLLPRDLKFCNLWLTTEAHGKTRTQCYKEAGFKVKNDNVAAVMAHRKLKDHKMGSYVRAMRNSSIESTGLTLEYLDAQLKNIIDGNAFEVMPIIEVITTDDKGNETKTYEPRVICESGDLPDEVKDSVQWVKVSGKNIEVKMYDKVAAIKLAMQRQGALSSGISLSNPDGSPLTTPVFEYSIVGGKGSEPALPSADEDEAGEDDGE